MTSTFALTNADKFKARLRQYAKQTVKAQIQDFQAQVATIAYNNLVFVSPVLTGHFRHNWIPRVGSPASGEVEGVAGVSATNAPMTAGEMAAISAIKKQLLAAPLGTTVYITNQVPYARRLERGYSKKAPSGVLSVSVSATLEQAKTLGKKIR